MELDDLEKEGKFPGKIAKKVKVEFTFKMNLSVWTFLIFINFKIFGHTTNRTTTKQNLYFKPRQVVMLYGESYESLDHMILSMYKIH